MIVEARKTLVWATAAAAVASAALLASSGGGGPRVAGLVGDAARGRPAAATRGDARAPAAAGTASAALH